MRNRHPLKPHECPLYPAITVLTLHDKNEKNKGAEGEWAEKGRVGTEAEP